MTDPTHDGAHVALTGESPQLTMGRRRRASVRRRWVSVPAALLVVLSLLATACASGRDSEADASSSTATEPAATAGATFGDLASPCGPGSASAATDQGVDASSITIGYGDDAGYQASPGLGHESSDAVRAMIGWCNEQGGINGREVKGVYYDAKITEIGNVMTEACQQSFMLVGSFFALPGAAEPTRLECGLPALPSIISGSEISNSPLMVTPFPQPIDYDNVAGAAVLAEKFPDAVKKTALLNADFPAVVDQTQRFTGTAGTVGWEFLDCTQTFPITGVADWRPILQQVKDCGAETIYTLLVGQNFQNMLDAAHQIDFDPIWYGNVSAYTDSFAAWNQAGNGDNVYFATPVVPIDDDTPGTANAAYKQIVTANDGDVAFSGQLAASAFLLWATATKACGDDVTRECVMDQLHGITDWDAGGLTAPQNPGENMAGSCMNVLKLNGPRYEQVAPENPLEFVCDPSYTVKADPPPTAMGQMNLDADRVSTRYPVG